MNELQDIIENRNEIISEKEINPAVIKVIDEIIKNKLDETTSNKIDNLNQEIMNLKDINTKLVFLYKIRIMKTNILKMIMKVK